MTVSFSGHVHFVSGVYIYVVFYFYIFCHSLFISSSISGGKIFHIQVKAWTVSDLV